MSKYYTSMSDVPNTHGVHLVRLHITTDLSGADVPLWVHVCVGSQPGPTLTLLSGMHGHEWLHLTFFRQFLEEFTPEAVSGRVIVIPFANAPALGSFSRNIRDDADNPDANRVFPGKARQQTWLSEQISAKVAEAIASSNYMIDFHLGMWGSVLGSTIVGIDYSREEVNKGSRELAQVFGTPLIFGTRSIAHFPGPRSGLGYAGEVMGIPACGSMLGGAGFDQHLEDGWMAANLQGIYNVMIHLGMRQGTLQLPERYLVYEAVQRMNPRVGGLLLPARPVEEFGRPIREGEVLGRVVSPFTFETLEELTVPFDGYLAYWARSYPIRPGDWAFCAIPKDHPGTRWVSYPDW